MVTHAQSRARVKHRGTKSVSKLGACAVTPIIKKNPALARFVDDLIRTRYATAHALAKAIGMSQSALSRGVQDEGTLSIENCIRLALAAGQHPSKVLRLALRREVADLIELAYGPIKELLNREEVEDITSWRELDGPARDAHRVLIQTTLEIQRRFRASTVPASGTDRAPSARRLPTVRTPTTYPVGSQAASPTRRKKPLDENQHG